MKRRKPSLSRRDFIKSLVSSGALAAMGPVGQSLFMRPAMAAAPAFGDYKAMVCLFLYGGNDCFNMLVPTGAAAGRGYGDYASIRGGLGVNNTDLGLATIAGGTDLNNGALATGAGNPYNVDLQQASAYLKGVYGLSGSNGIELGINGVMPELAQLITDQKASIIANVGTLANPITRGEIQTGTANLPLFLFSHNHQQRELQTGQADNLDDTGWAGRIADNWLGINSSSPLGLNISYYGNDRMLIGDTTAPLALTPGSPPVFTGMNITGGSSDQDRRAIFQALAGIQNASSTGNVSFDSNNTFTSTDPFKTLYNNMLGKSMATFDQLKAAWDSTTINYTTTGPYGEALFGVPSSADLGFASGISGSLINQLDAVTKMIHMGATGVLGSGYNRQVFFLVMGGFDNHSSQVDVHPLKLREISLGLWKFQKALEELSHANKVTTFTMSDFGRTMTNNGDGTDHGWGGHHLVMGGDGNATAGNLNGGQLIGTLPDLRLGSNDDYSDKGRIIPTLAQDQLNATLCNWFGVDSSLMPTIFPNLANFQSGGTIDSAYLNTLFV